MMSETTFDAISLWILFAATALLLVTGNFTGFKLGIWQRSRRSEEDKASASAIMGSTLGLLAFLLAFTFGMSSSRFDARRNLVLEESSAILKTYQRAQFLPPEQKSACSELLREYVELRLNLITIDDPQDIQAAIQHSETIQDELWAQASSLAEHPNAILSGFIQSLADLSDLQMKRVRGTFWNRIPATIQTMLYTLAFLGMMTMGYNAGLAGTRPTLPTLVLVLTFSAVIVLIVDLERPSQTMFHVSQESMLSVQQRIGHASPGGS